MATDEEIWRISPNLLGNAAVVLPRIAADVRHPHVNSLALESFVFRVPRTNGSIVYVSVYPSQWLEFCKFVGDMGGPKIARMPDFIAVFEVVVDRRIQVPVSIR